MLFVAVISHRDAILARVSVEEREGETAAQLAVRARETLKRDANKSRSSVLSDAVLEGFADAYGDVVADGAMSRSARVMTCIARSDAVHRMDGMVATLTGPEDLVCLIDTRTDADVAETDRLLDSLFGAAA